WSGASWPTARSASPAGSTPPKPNGPSTGTCRPRSGSAPRWPSRAPCSSPSPTSRCRWRWTSRSPPGRPGPARRANGPVTTPPRPARPTRSRSSAGPRTIRRRSRSTMKILHTSDWHVGKVLKGRDRHDEHAAALGSIVRTARDEDVDVVLIAGDLFETAAPNARAQGLVMRTLLALREDGRQVVAIAGNHDNQNLLDAVYRPVLGELGLHVLGLPKRPGQGGTVALRTRGGETANVAALPFLSHRYAVRAAEVLLHDFAEHTLD